MSTRKIQTTGPTDDVYYPALTPTVRLVTCGGEFDPAAAATTGPM